jgi:pimeloyl-ACP methyl ester carboxylesterase
MQGKAFRFRGEKSIMDHEARASAPGSFVELEDGLTHYELLGSPEGTLVVLIHGFSIPFQIWDPTVAPFLEAGLRVLRYDLYGRGFSDRPLTAYNRDLFDRQLSQLLSALELPTPVSLIGLSMGGSIAVVFCDLHPERVRKLCLIDPAGFPTKILSWSKLIARPFLGEWLMNLFGERFLLSSLSDDLFGLDRYPQYIQIARQQMHYEGFRRALLSTMRNDVLGDLSAAYARVGTQGHPTMLIWGRHDRVIPIEVSARVLQAMPQTEFHAIEEAGHVPHYEQPEIVNPILIQFLLQ